jgi:hypothetical protein
MLQRRQHAAFVLLHKAAVADHIGSEDSGEATLEAFGHILRLLPMRPRREIVLSRHSQVHHGLGVVWVNRGQSGNVGSTSASAFEDAL